MDFETENKYDKVRVYEGSSPSSNKKLVEWSGSFDMSSDTILGGTNRMLVRFTTDFAIQKKGFRLTWKAGKEIPDSMMMHDM